MKTLINKPLLALLLLTLPALATVATIASAQPREFPNTPADTGVSGVYEVMIGAADAQPVIDHMQLFGFRVVAEGSFTAAEARRLYGVDSALKSFRLQNGDIDSHGLVRVLQWQQPVGSGVDYSQPSTLGHRIAAMRIVDITRVMDAFEDERDADGRRLPWLPRGPAYANIYKADTDTPGLYDRRVGVRESAVYGSFFNHVFFQRYGYDVPGYGTLNWRAPFVGSEFTHHDFVLAGDPYELLAYYVTALGFKPEESEPQLFHDHSPGSTAVFNLPPGARRYYLGMVSPNNICGKLKFFMPDYPVTDRRDRVDIGAPGMNMHSLYVRDLRQMQRLLRQHGISFRSPGKNEFGTQSLVFTGPDGANWQLLQGVRPTNKPVTEFRLVKTDWPGRPTE